MSATRALLQQATDRLRAAGLASPAADARWLLTHVLQVDNLVWAPAAVTAAQAGRYLELVERRAARQPLQHLTGEMAFRRLVLASAPGVFIVRPETEAVAGAAIAAGRAAGSRPLVVDLCTGSGAIALALATEVPGAQVWAVELGAEPLRLAAANAERVGASIHLVPGDIRRPLPALAALAGRCDVVVSNPPYIPPTAVPRDPEVRDHDPALALYGDGPDGLGHVRAVLARAAELLRPGGSVLIEHADCQGLATRTMATQAGFRAARTARDDTDRDRYLVATWPGEEPGDAAD